MSRENPYDIFTMSDHHLASHTLPRHSIDEVRPRTDRGWHDLISVVLSYGSLWYVESMLRIALVLASLLLGTQIALADDQTRFVQEELRAQGFYYGPIDGKPGVDLTAALRRYQIRNGLQITGQPDDATAKSLDIKTAEASPSSNPIVKWPDEPVLRSDAVREDPPAQTETPSNEPLRNSPQTSETRIGNSAFEERRVTQFLSGYLRDGETEDIEAQVRYFGFPAQYFDRPDATQDYVRRDTANYVRHWPTRHYLLTDPVKITPIGTDTATVEFTIAFEVQNSQHRVTGRTANRLTLRVDNGQLKIVAIRERHLRD